jgi:hypothetical protein
VKTGIEANIGNADIGFNGVWLVFVYDLFNHGGKRYN